MEKASKLSIEERQVGDVVVLSLTGEITLDDGDLKFGRKIDELLGMGQHRILVDLGGVTYIDSAGVGMMVFEHKAVRAKAGALKLFGLTAHSHRLLALMRLKSLFEVFEDEAMALGSFARN